jgi:hypothetical protein
MRVVNGQRFLGRAGRCFGGLKGGPGALSRGGPVVGGGSRVSLGGGVRAWTRVRRCESRCGDRQEQEGKRLPAHPLVKAYTRVRDR